MDLKTKLQDSLVKKAIRTVIEKSNDKIDFTALISNSGTISDLDKKLVIRITDMGENTGLGIKDGKMVEIDKVDNPDTIFSMNKQTFTAIILNKINHKQAFFMGAVEADGNNWIRDGILLGKVMDEIKKVMYNKR